MVKTQIFFHGSYSGKTGEMYAGIVCEHDFRFRHTGLNGSSADHAEWIAAICAVEYAIDRGLTQVELVGDSANVIGALNRKRRTKEDLLPLRRQVEDMCAEALCASWRWIGRDMNPAGRMLADLKATGGLRSRGLFG